MKNFLSKKKIKVFWGRVFTVKPKVGDRVVFRKSMYMSGTVQVGKTGVIVAITPTGYKIKTKMFDDIWFPKEWVELA